MKKKVIFVTKALWIGGIETALLNLLNHFNYDRYDVTLLVLRAELDMVDRIHPRCRLLVADREKLVSFQKPYKFSKLFHLTEETDNPSKLHKAMMWTVPAIKYAENRLYIQYIRNLMKGEHFDAAIIYSDVAAETAIRAIKAGKYLLFYHHGAMRRVYHDEIAYKKCDKIIAVSKNQAEELKKFVPKYSDKIITIHNLTDIEGIRAKAQFPTEEEFDPSKFNIVSVGRVSHEKGMDIAVRVCSKLVEHGFNDVIWWIIGDGPAMQEVRDTVAELHIEDHVKLVGMKSNPYPYIRQADLYVQPSRLEGYPMTILESLVLGQPVVSTDNNGAREIIKNNITGILCPIGVDKIVDAIEKILTMDNMLSVLKTNVLNKDFRKQNLQYIELLERIL